MKVTFVLPGIARHPIGGYRVVYAYANFLAGRGHHVEILQSRTRARRGIREVAVRLAYLLWRSRRPTWFALSPAVRVRNAATPRAEAVAEDCDVVVATALGTADFVSSISSARRTPVYLIQHFEDFGVDREEVLRTWRLPMRRVAVSSWLVDIAINEGLNCDLVENGIDLDVFRPGPPTEQREPSVLAMVSDQSWKRTDLVVEMMQEIERLHPDFVLRTFGTCDRPSDLPATVTHHRDPLPDALVDLYQRSQVFVCASDFEGFGLPALEAMACGSAVVSTDNGGVPAFSRGAAEVVPSGSARALVERVLSLMSDRASRVEVCDRGHRRAMELSLPNSCLAFETILVDSVNVDV